jgi:hypothetical protein
MAWTAIGETTGLQDIVTGGDMQGIGSARAAARKPDADTEPDGLSPSAPSECQATQSQE